MGTSSIPSTISKFLEIRLTIAVGTLVRAGAEGMPVGRLQSRLDLAASTLSHHLKTLIGVGLVTQAREGTTLFCHANYELMRGLIEYMVEECCAEGTCAPVGLAKLPKVA